MQLAVTPDRITSYWRASLADAERMSLDSRRLADAPRVHPAQVAAGRLKPEIAAKLARNMVKSAQPQREQAQPLDVLVCPIIAHLASPQTQNNLPDPLVPLWVPAILAPNGELLPPEDVAPWIAREILEPAERARLTLGTVDELDRFLSSGNRPAGTDGWTPYWNYCQRMLFSVTGLSMAQFAVEGYRIAVDTALIVPADMVQGTRQHIIRLYDRMLADRRFPPLFQRFAAQTDAHVRPLHTEVEQRAPAARHLGQMGGKFPLSASQRETLHHFLSIQQGEILAVNGPPGTGKTTLIQNIVAALWVEAAVQGGEPPVIVAASTNNQAVTNIIDSFAKGVEGESLLSKRWLPDVSSYGLYCASESRRETAGEKGIPVVFPNSDRDHSGFFAVRETSDYLARASVMFLDRCAEFFHRRPAGLEDAQQLLRQRLHGAVEEIHAALRLWDRVQDARARLSATTRLHGTPQLALASLRDLAQKAEATARQLWHITDGWQKQKSRRSFFDSFRPARIEQSNREYFAAHTSVIQPPAMDDATIPRVLKAEWEAAQQRAAQAEAELRALETDLQQIQDLEQAWQHWCAARMIGSDEAGLATYLDTQLRYRAFCLASHYWEVRWLLETRQLLQASRDERPSVERQMTRWQRYAKLTPCFVSTLFMTPRFFSTWENRQYRPLYESIDLLIIDEAGQVPADVGAATFALAKKALVVGDTFQIEPVYTLTPTVDAANLQRYVGIREPAALARFRAQGQSAVAGSLMVVAQRASSYQKVSFVRGMFLSEHRRCLPEIIAICNELAYGGALAPLRPAEEGLPLPPLGYAHIAGDCVSTRGSRGNNIEAETIVHWIRERQEQLEQYYARSGNTRSIEDLVGIITPFTHQADLLRRQLHQAGLPCLTVGTVHALQGAERPVVIFSPVYDRPGTLFFDQGVNMLNVAISRAQDSFLVFGNMALFEPAPPMMSRRPSSVLARHLFDGAGVELVVKTRRTRSTQPRGATIRRLGTLAEHRRTLVDALSKARMRVVIVSPYLSSMAIQADRIDTLIAAAVQRGVTVTVFTDSQLDVDRRTGRLKSHAEAARQQLRACGADLRIVRRIHNKTLCADESTIVMGSFNWLSAVRDETNAFQRLEESIQYEGVGVAEMIANVLHEMNQQAVIEAP